MARDYVIFVKFVSWECHVLFLLKLILNQLLFPLLDKLLQDFLLLVQVVIDVVKDD